MVALTFLVYLLLGLLCAGHPFFGSSALTTMGEESGNEMAYTWTMESVFPVVCVKLVSEEGLKYVCFFGFHA